MSRAERRNYAPSSEDLYLRRDLGSSDFEPLPSEEMVKLSQRISRGGMARSLLSDFESGNLSGERSLQFKKPAERIFDTPITMGLAKGMLDELGLGGKIALSSSESEKDRYDNDLTGYMAEAISYKWFPAWLRGPDLREDEKEATRQKLEKIIKDSAEARNGFVNANLRLVESIAREYPTSKDIELVDHFQEGSVGLIHAVGKFDWRLGYEFSTYATRWIKQSISRGLRNKKGPIRVSLHMQELRERVQSAYQKAKVDLNGSGGEPDPKVVERIVNEGATANGRRLSAETIEYILYADPGIQNPLSLGAPIGADSDKEIMDLIPDDREDPSVEATDLVAFEEKERQIEELLGLLPKRKGDILRRRFGLDGGGGRTLEEIGKELGLTRERVRQIEEKALAELRSISKTGRKPQTEEMIVDSRILSVNKNRAAAFEKLTYNDLLKIFSEKGLLKAAKECDVSPEVILDRMKELESKKAS